MNFAILEMRPMPAVNIFDGDLGRSDEIGLGVPGDVGGGVKSGFGCHDETKVDVMSMSKNFGIEKV